MLAELNLSSLWLDSLFTDVLRGGEGDLPSGDFPFFGDSDLFVEVPVDVFTMMTISLE
jgi:hypothetical protein